MKRIIKYGNGLVQSYIGATEEEIDNIQWETEEHMRKIFRDDNPYPFDCTETLFDDTPSAKFFNSIL